ncbi:efflux RND transporter permease subunit, partial [Photobacterium sp. OFAV2-7]|uniref:efflux RND transporter permease subunit n=1 Tax=Photobacterium sp. OFAV2-7 TaxID=2917748 RepID=UPI001EF47527
MGFVEYFIKNRIVSVLLSLILLLGGMSAFNGLGRLEDPAFTVKVAVITTVYPGAPASQVEQEVTYPIENAVQQLPYVDYIKSTSSAGLSQVTVNMKEIYRADALKQIWDELRNKVSDLSSQLPSGVQTPMVMDDFADVFGILLTVSGDGYSYAEITDYVDLLRRELVLIEGVGNVTIAGEQEEQVIVEISKSKASALDIPMSRIYQNLRSQNQVSDSGSVRVGEEYIRIQPSGEYDTIRDLESLIVSGDHSNSLIYLKDIASIKREYAEVPRNIINHDNQQALMLGVSFASGVNVVEVGERIDQRLAEMEYSRPAGMILATVYNQPNEVNASIDSFIDSLLQAVAIVVFVLLVFMGIKSGILIGLVLLITVFGTFIFMSQMGIELHRISLGALIIALGMLVDNAIVVVEGILIGLKRGQTKLSAAVSITRQTSLPLLGATVIAIAAFSPIGLSSDATGEFAGSLFWVLLISLSLSWVTAITLTPFLADLIFKELPDSNEQQQKELYKGAVYSIYRFVLGLCIRYKFVTIVALVLLFSASVVGFGKVKQAFFPASNTPIFYVDYWRYQGSDIRETLKDVREIEAYLLKQDVVEQVTTTVGSGFPRFILTYNPENSYAAYGQLVVRVNTREDINPTLGNVRQYLVDNYPQAEFKLKRMEMGTGGDAKVEARFTGPDPDVLRKLSGQAIDILRRDPGAENVRHNWRQRAKVIRPVFNESKARRVGISKQEFDDALLTNFSGKQIGTFREGTKQLPIIARSPDNERMDINNLLGVQVYSPATGSYISLSQLVDEVETVWEDGLILRRDRKRTITVLADPDILGNDTATSLLMRVKSDIEAIELPPGYTFEWGGEYESSADAQKALSSGLPLAYLAMFIITVLLFNNLKSPLIIWLTVPLALIGVVSGLLLFDVSFSFMALVGLLSLSGMLIKNGIVLVDQINLELVQGKDSYTAVCDA